MLGSAEIVWRILATTPADRPAAVDAHPVAALPALETKWPSAIISRQAMELGRFARAGGTRSPACAAPNWMRSYESQTRVRMRALPPAARKVPTPFLTPEA